MWQRWKTILLGATSVHIIVDRVRSTSGDVIASQVQLLSNCISCLESEIQHHLIQFASLYTNSVSAKFCISRYELKDFASAVVLIGVVLNCKVTGWPSTQPEMQLKVHLPCSYTPLSSAAESITIQTDSFAQICIVVGCKDNLFHCWWFFQISTMGAKVRQEQGMGGTRLG